MQEGLGSQWAASFLHQKLAGDTREDHIHKGQTQRLLKRVELALRDIGNLHFLPDVGLSSHTPRNGKGEKEKEKEEEKEAESTQQSKNTLGT